MKHALVWGSSLAILVIAMTSACGKSVEGEATKAVAEAACDLKAVSASTAESKRRLQREMAGRQRGHQPAAVDGHAQQLQGDDP